MPTAPALASFARHGLDPEIICADDDARGLGAEELHDVQDCVRSSCRMGFGLAIFRTSSSSFRQVNAFEIYPATQAGYSGAAVLADVGAVMRRLVVILLDNTIGTKVFDGKSGSSNSPMTETSSVQI